MNFNEYLTVDAQAFATRMLREGIKPHITLVRDDCYDDEVMYLTRCTYGRFDAKGSSNTIDGSWNMAVSRLNDAVNPRKHPPPVEVTPEMRAKYSGMECEAQAFAVERHG